MEIRPPTLIPHPTAIRDTRVHEKYLKLEQTQAPNPIRFIIEVVLEISIQILTRIDFIIMSPFVFQNKAKQQM